MIIVSGGNIIKQLSICLQQSRSLKTNLHQIRKVHKNRTSYSIYTAKEEIVPSSFIDFRGNWPAEELKTFTQDMRITPNFVTPDEESKILEEIEPYMRRLHYEYDHWDDAIHGFRETERKQWYPDNRNILDRVRHLAFDGEVMPYVHVLDLAEQGVIKPHVDSARYCGNIIAGISLLSDSVMRLVRTDEKKFQQSKGNSVESSNNTDDYRSQPKVSLENNFYADILLQRYSLYIMSHSARYNFTHEILANGHAEFQGAPVLKGRRISIICRNNP